MSAEKKWTDRDLALAKREAWSRARSEALLASRYFRGNPEVRARLEAEQLYPLPLVERPRVVKGPHGSELSWRVDGDVLMYRFPTADSDGQWEAYAWPKGFQASVTPERVALWHDLFTRPAEMVDAEESDSASVSQGGEV